MADDEPISLIEQWIGRRWSITIALMLMIIVLVGLKEVGIAQTVVGFLGIIIGYFFKDIADSNAQKLELKR
jgi:hypothetical protein